MPSASLGRSRLLPVLILFGVLMPAACEGARQKSLRVTLTSLNAARDGFTAWDSAKQQRIVEASTSFEEGAKQLNVYRNSRIKIVQAFTAAYSALALAAVDSSPASLIEAAKAARELYDLIKQFREGD